MRTRANGIELEYETTGHPADAALVLIMGMGAQLIDWPALFYKNLAAHGFYVVRFDNRDAGLSTGFDHLGVPDPFGAPVADPPYLLADMAADTVGLFDALGLDSVHLVGQSLGGMVAQQVAIDHPLRVLSLCSLSSTTGDSAVGRPAPELDEAARVAPGGTREEIIAHWVADARRMGSPGFAAPSDGALYARFAAKYDRAYRPDGRMRQYAAVVAAGDRTAALRSLTVPTIVIHGDADVLIGLDGGRATASAIPGAELVIVSGMGHGVPAGAVPQVVEAIVSNARRAEAGG